MSLEFAREQLRAASRYELSLPSVYKQSYFFHACRFIYLFYLWIRIDVALLPINSERKFLLADKFDTFD